MSPINSNGSSLEVTTNYGNGLEQHRESTDADYKRNQQTEPSSNRARTKTVVINKEAKTKTTYKRQLSPDEEKLIAASDKDLESKNIKPKKPRKSRVKKTPTTDKK